MHVCPGFRLEYGIPDLNDASTKLGLCSNINYSPHQITYHPFLKLAYPDSAETQKSACTILNELILSSPEAPEM